MADRNLIDSGAQITFISDTLFKTIRAEVCGFILIQGVIGDSIRCPISNVIIKQIGDENTVNVAHGVPVVCAVAPISTNTHDVVLPPEILNEIESVRWLRLCTCRMPGLTLAIKSLVNFIKVPARIFPIPFL